MVMAILTIGDDFEAMKIDADDNDDNDDDNDDDDNLIKL